MIFEASSQKGLFTFYWQQQQQQPFKNKQYKKVKLNSIDHNFRQKIEGKSNQKEYNQQSTFEPNSSKLKVQLIMKKSKSKDGQQQQYEKNIVKQKSFRFDVKNLKMLKHVQIKKNSYLKKQSQQSSQNLSQLENDEKDIKSIKSHRKQLSHFQKPFKQLKKLLLNCKQKSKDAQKISKQMSERKIILKNKQQCIIFPLVSNRKVLQSPRMNTFKKIASKFQLPNTQNQVNSNYNIFSRDYIVKATCEQHYNQTLNLMQKRKDNFLRDIYKKNNNNDS